MTVMYVPLSVFGCHVIMPFKPIPYVEKLHGKQIAILQENWQ